MVTIKPKTITDIKFHAEGTTHARTDMRIRDLDVVIDEPEARGGTNQGISPTETVMAALAGCTNVITNRIAEHMGMKISAFSVDVDAKFDRRGVMLQEALRVPFPEVQLTINLTTNADDAAVEKLKTDLAKYCPVSAMIRASGTVITEIWNVTKG